MEVDEDADLAAALALSKAKDPVVADKTMALLGLPKAKQDASLTIITKLLQNLVKEPGNEKFRSVRLSNAKIKAAIGDIPEAKAVMLACGFVEQGENLVATSGAEDKASEALAVIEEATGSYTLSVEYSGHAGAVRCVCALPDGVVATGAMDNVVRLFPPTGGTSRCLMGHARTVGVDGILAICAAGLGQLASAGRDGKVMLWDVSSGEKKSELIGHGEGIDVTNAKSIAALSITSDGTLISGGWDKTARIWGAAPQVLVGHQVAVNGVCALPGGDIVTVSGDQTVVIWRGGSRVLTADAGSPGRGVCAVGTDGVAFASAHNDGKVRTWGATGSSPLKVAVASSSYLFSVSYCAARAVLATGGDDGSVKVWTIALEQVQSIQHPMEVFAVAFAANGDLLTACGDERARLWTRDSSRSAPAAILQDFSAKVSAAAAASAAAGVAPASAAAPGGGNWDFEYPVDLTGGKKMTLRWRRGENANDIANRFLQENGLPANHLPDVIAFVQQTMSQAGAQAGQGGAPAAQGGRTHSYPVEVADGRRLTIQWTHGEDPIAVAQRFAMANMIQAAELQDIASFVAQVQGSAPPAAAAPQAAAPISAESIGLLTSMGFDEATARAALQAAGGNVELAITRLVG